MLRPEPLSVKELNLYIKTLIDRDEFLSAVYVRGEISNLKKHYTGHWYFTLKDGEALIKCVMFKSYTANVLFDPQDGMSVLLLGNVAVYERDGVYQIYVKGMEPDGVGALHAMYEQLKAKLEAKGMFDASHKKPIPILPKAIGVVTSQTGAVIRDIINVTTRRLPNVHIKLYPAAVQGTGAAETIVKGIAYFNEAKNVDVIIVARGGGSLEDLWPFNEEITANAIYESEIPVISAVGHETDFTIADFVADLRAPTPSAAGELAVPDKKEWLWKLQNINHRMALSLKKTVEAMRVRYQKILQSKVMKQPLDLLNEKRILLDTNSKNIITTMRYQWEKKQHAFATQVTALEALSPLKTLARGYALVEDSSGQVITKVNQLTPQQEIKLMLSDGEATANVLQITEKDHQESKR